MEIIRKILAHNLVRIREARNLKQHEVADACGFETPTYNRWENGRAWPKPDSIQALSDFYKVPSSEFYRDISDTPVAPSLSEALNVLEKETGIVLKLPKSISKNTVPPDVADSAASYSSDDKVWDLVRGVFAGQNIADKKNSHSKARA